MNDERIKVRVTSTGQTLEVVVLNKRLEMIEVVLGVGVHNVRCTLTPTRTGSAYAGNAGGADRLRAQPRRREGRLARAAGFRDFSGDGCSALGRASTRFDIALSDRISTESRSRRRRRARAHPGS
jgi:hypothetical protein